MFKNILGMFNSIFNWRENAEQAYYNGATDICDLERRMKAVQRGNAPWQKAMW